ncbi:MULTISPECIES: polysaccharide pyruvyl transferase family protein [Acinetobacter]|uniref:polysaccharide pyruvyl transferase family protein n=1 Tax=Acinetobacter TaxID=469 RepID=UPI000F73631D|nr:polysaccharide pyruvyl transferase family protein [Acinetobacter haemolyticus]RSN75491.1 polysaccharide pyruvyl transferase family protein [Acinetobacter haemolyticus]
MQNIGIFNTAIGSSNLGDHIIMDSVLKEMSTLINNRQQIHFSSHDAHLYNALKLQKIVKYNLLCGTNCLGSKMWYRPSWAVNIFTAGFIKPTITLGVGWGAYQKDPDFYSRKLLKKLLVSDGMLSVRDEYTKQKLEKSGFDNVVNTACLTMWGLTNEKCKLIMENKQNKASKVVYTLTDYAPDFNLDFFSIKTLLDSYEKVLIWIQGARDWSYFKAIVEKELQFFSNVKNRIELIPPVLSTYDNILAQGDIDYVGTRLHGGIRALQKGVRTIIIGVDNRALEKKKDFNLPVINRKDVDGLKDFVEASYDLNIKLPEQNIAKFKEWFTLYNNSFNDDFLFSNYSL